MPTRWSPEGLSGWKSRAVLRNITCRHPYASGFMDFSQSALVKRLTGYSRDDPTLTSLLELPEPQTSRTVHGHDRWRPVDLRCHKRLDIRSHLIRGTPSSGCLRRSVSRQESLDWPRYDAQSEPPRCSGQTPPDDRCVSSRCLFKSILMLQTTQNRPGRHTKMPATLIHLRPVTVPWWPSYTTRSPACDELIVKARRSGVWTSK